MCPPHPHAEEHQVEEVFEDICVHHLEEFGVMFYYQGNECDAQYIE